MKKTSLTRVLTDLGLSENEAKVYIAALALGASTVLHLAQASELKRTTVYSVLESLQLKGIIAVEVKGFKRRFVAESPELLENILESRRERLHTALPELSALYNLKGENSIIKYYEGLAGLKTSFNELLKNLRRHDEYWVISAYDWQTVDAPFFNSYIRRRAKIDLEYRLLLPNQTTVEQYKELDRNPQSQIKVLPAKYKVGTNMIITRNQVLLHQLKPPMLAIVITNPHIVTLQRELFEMIWDTVGQRVI